MAAHVDVKSHQGNLLAIRIYSIYVHLPKLENKVNTNTGVSRPPDLDRQCSPTVTRGPRPLPTWCWKARMDDACRLLGSRERLRGLLRGPASLRPVNIHRNITTPTPHYSDTSQLRHFAGDRHFRC